MVNPMHIPPGYVRWDRRSGVIQRGNEEKEKKEKKEKKLTDLVTVGVPGHYRLHYQG